jgi:hypothetical protein
MCGDIELNACLSYNYLTSKSEQNTALPGAVVQETRLASFSGILIEVEGTSGRAVSHGRATRHRRARGLGGPRKPVEDLAGTNLNEFNFFFDSRPQQAHAVS